ncbi:MAG TPA: universal stress protein [Xanthobacteraceae bacterium]|nr:universal stress protein [Xanthobacteraceae bacterium]
MIKDVVVNLGIGKPHDVAAGYAVAIAEAFNAHLCAVAFAYEPVVPPSIMGGVPLEVIEAQWAASERAADAAIAAFEAAAKRAGIASERRKLAASLGGAGELFGRLARRFDLSVVGQTEPKQGAAQDLVIEGALFGSGRPVIVVPYIHHGGLGLDRVLVCWDGGRAAARAVADAMPLLARAGAIDVVMVESGRRRGASDEIPGVDVGEHLARHGLKIEVKRVVSTDVDVPNTILSHAADSGTDFIVMGGYGHSRLREFILGGATQGVLASMTVPVLMSH